MAFAITMTGFVVRSPQFLIAIFSKDFIIDILSPLTLMALAVGIVFGTTGGMIGWWIGPHRPKEVRTS
jgi:hypothetical protein